MLYTESIGRSDQGWGSKWGKLWYSAGHSYSTWWQM